MRLTHKTFFTVSAVLAGLIAAAYGLASAVLMDGFLEVERRTTSINLLRAADAVRAESESLNARLGAWASAAETRRFIADPNSAGSLVDRRTMEALGASVVVLADADRRVLFSASADPASAPLSPAAPALIALIHSSEPTVRFSSPDASAAGLVLIPEGLFAVACRPVTADHGPSIGVALFAQRLDDAAMARIAQRTHMELSIKPSDGRSPPGRVLIEPLDSRRLAATSALLDVHGRPTLELGAVLPRYTFLQAVASVRYLLIALVSVGAAFTGVVLILISRLVLAPLGRLNAEVTVIGASGDLGHRVPGAGRDEIAALGRSINALLAASETSHRAVRDSEERIRGQARELSAARDQAQTASRAKSEFLANMSHEIRTPMTAIIGFADLLQDPTLSASDRAEYVQIIRRNGDHLLTLINDILDLSKIEEGKMAVERIPCSPVQIVAEVYSLMQVRALHRGVSLFVEHQFPIPATIRSDPVRLRQILVNLVGNAIKFTGQGGSVRIRTRFIPHAPAGPALAVEVADTGVGMSPDQAARLFRPFSQADTSMTRRFGGTGLGLSISRRLAALLDGDITLTSQPGSGSTFTATIATGPIDDVEMITGEVCAAPTPSEAPALPRISGRILLAEDGPDNQRLICFYLRKAGAHVEVAESGRTAVERAIAAAGNPDERFHLVLMDMQLPDLDGYAAAGELRRRGYTGAVVALTAHAMTGDREKCLAAGCDDYLAKPVNRFDLLRASAHWCSAAAPVRADPGADPLPRAA